MNNKLKKIFAICFYAFFINGVTALIFGAIMPNILTDFNLGYDQGGMLLSVQSIGNLLISFIAGMVSVYLGRRTAIVVLSSMTALGFLAMSFTTTPALLFLPFFLTGAGRGSVTNIGNSIINEESDSRAGPLNLLHTFFAVGAFMTPLFAAWALDTGYSWRWILRLIAILAAILVIAFRMMPIDNTKGVAKKRVITDRSNSFLKNTDFYLAAGILFFYVGVEYAVNGWIVTYLRDAGIMSAAMAQRILSILWIIIIFGRLFSSFISNYVDKKSILLVSSIGTVIFFALFILSSNLWAIIICILGLGFCLSGIYPTTVSDVGQVLTQSPMAMGTLLAVAGLGGILMPYLVGVVAELRGITGGMIAISVAVVLMFVLTLVNRIRRRDIQTF